MALAEAKRRRVSVDEYLNPSPCDDSHDDNDSDSDSSEDAAPPNERDCATRLTALRYRDTRYTNSEVCSDYGGSVSDASVDSTRYRPESDQTPELVPSIQNNDATVLKESRPRQQSVLLSLREEMPSIHSDIDFSAYRNTTKAQPITWAKGGPISFSPDTELLDTLTEEEATLCRTLRLFPTQYVRIKHTVISATYTRPVFKKKELRQWFPIDVNKVNKLFDWFHDLGWIPSEDKEWTRRREWLTAKQ
ncbi:Transcriptional adapter ada2 [Podochytrium sp. JEL0797]|nr:Transcriptional adapter ada2 [Podochytrium sp. JEL0797]